ncbi:fumarate reductase/succinate dehydrogenase flavoprotein domain protein [Sphingobium chlorophenolicum L-1]|uniref:Fumarate reductase/succinate dehydrogenase flavoprotein domain protein n=1 Tax=Sphingobium chlorophenolicum L-1 TaxID=690566 RepID=F6F249_SPHCR|nr:fumarate reductase/succinate dehydrogenase flavoprotein domain protein [Sphingobium chlorophenolicum L-1]
MGNGVDVIVVGSGAAGFSAAISAAAAGASVLLLEKAERVGGTTAWSGGGVWVPGNHHMADLGESDSVEKARTYIAALTGNHFDPALTGKFLEKGPEAIAFLERTTDWVRFRAYPIPDYHPDQPGAAEGGRTMLAEPFDARVLGRNLAKLRLPKRELTVLGGMQVELDEVPHLQAMWRSARSFGVSLRLLRRYAADRLRFGRHTRLIRGNALAGALFRSAIDLGVVVRTGAAVVKLERTGSRVTGVTVRIDGKTESLSARRGVILCSGGFSGNAEMVARYFPDAAQHITILPPENQGEGLAMAREIGAAFGESNAANAIWAPGSSHVDRRGRRMTWPHFGLDRYKPGAIMVDGKGDRFVNEAASYHVIGNRMHELGVSPAWLIGDRAFLRKYGMGMVRPAPYSPARWISEGYLIEAPTIAALAERIGCDPAHLERSVARMNEAARTGVDPDFAKGGDIYNRVGGDPAHRPNPCLGPIRTGPFYALALHVTDAGTTLGLRVNDNAQVLDSGGAPIDGLYAAGLDMNSVLRGTYAGGGTMLGPALTFGYVAGRHVVGDDGR